MIITRQNRHTVNSHLWHYLNFKDIISFSVYDDALENFGDDFDVELLNPTPFDQLSSKLTDENDQSNYLDTTLPPPAILLTKNAQNGKNPANTSIRTLKIKLATLMNHVANIMKNVEDQGSKDDKVGLEW